mmetsp:Transcript_58105/g.95953  ORF Transcript_58105/g.95953 Transcript_58105/m.95953 type:complete len:216 (+) Transcript_58105:1346-1993(+)
MSCWTGCADQVCFLLTRQLCLCGINASNMATPCRMLSATCTCTQQTRSCGSSAFGPVVDLAHGSTRWAIRITLASSGLMLLIPCSSVATRQAARPRSTRQTWSTACTARTTMILTRQPSLRVPAVATSLRTRLAGCESCRSGTSYHITATRLINGPDACASYLWGYLQTLSGSSTPTSTVEWQTANGRCLRCCGREWIMWTAYLTRPQPSACLAG